MSYWKTSEQSLLTIMLNSSSKSLCSTDNSGHYSCMKSVDSDLSDRYIDRFSSWCKLAPKRKVGGKTRTASVLTMYRRVMWPMGATKDSSSLSSRRSHYYIKRSRIGVAGPWIVGVTTTELEAFIFIIMVMCMMFTLLFFPLTLISFNFK